MIFAKKSKWALTWNWSLFGMHTIHWLPWWPNFGTFLTYKSRKLEFLTKFWSRICKNMIFHKIVKNERLTWNWSLFGMHIIHRLPWWLNFGTFLTSKSRKFEFLTKFWSRICKNMIFRKIVKKWAFNLKLKFIRHAYHTSVAMVT